MTTATQTRRPAAAPLARIARQHTGWQAERRGAAEILRRQRAAALARCDWPLLDALTFALMDVERALRERAEAEITESFSMRWVHEVMQ